MAAGGVVASLNHECAAQGSKCAHYVTPLNVIAIRLTADQPGKGGGGDVLSSCLLSRWISLTPHMARMRRIRSYIHSIPPLQPEVLGVVRRAAQVQRSLELTSKARIMHARFN